MEDLKTILENNMSIVDIDDKVNRFVDSAKDYDDKLKLTFVALNLLKKGSELLKSVDPNDFISQVTEKINEMKKEKETLSKEYGFHLEQNDNIISVFGDKTDQIIEKQKKIQTLLSEYDEIIKKLVEQRETLSVEQQISIEKK